MTSRSKDPVESFGSLKVTGTVSTGYVEAMLTPGLLHFVPEDAISHMLYVFSYSNVALFFHLEVTHFL